ncbi:MAG TPA: SpoIIE family protein phosphatase [Edaphobacter sp.]|nr:SpoIIE family protein phosphatase [Edaphobacter sp.]
MRADRLMSALLMLQAKGQMTSRELAEKLEVSERTVHRDMEALSAAGVPVYAMRGSHGGWQIDEDWRTQVPGLDEAELRALLMAQPRSLGDKHLAAAADRAIGKLMASLPAPLRERASSIRDRLYIDTTGWRGTSENLSMLTIVQEAVACDRKLFFYYWRAGKERVERTVDPLGLVAKGSTWYLFAGTDHGHRTYRISRMEGARVLDEPSIRPRNFDLEAAWKISAEEFRDEVKREMEMARLAYEARRDAERRAAQELEIARQVQARLFPQRLPPLRSLDYAGTCIQAREVGGDYYDFLHLGEHRLGLVIGDIAGKGIAGALLMANLQANLRGQLGTFLECPQELLHSVNQLFFENTTDNAYATLFFGEYDDQRQKLHYANCGHLPALLIRNSGRIDWLDSTCTVVGLFADWQCKTEETSLEPGDIFALFTDGVTEASNKHGEEFGLERLAEAMQRHKHLPSQHLLTRIAEELQGFRHEEQQDDITLIVARCRETEQPLLFPASA